MKIKFDQNQSYQLDAINAVLDAFDGQPLAQGEQEIIFEAPPGQLLTELGIANGVVLSDEKLLSNVNAVQERNDIAPIEALAGRNFSVEMETGTGKTYVYLRTIFELQARYGWKKFIIVVPSVAIREGVLQTIEMTRDHFAALYNNVPLDAWVYDSAQVSRLRGFATSNQMQLLIINIQAFDKKDIAVIHRDNDKLSGRQPIEFIQGARPIVIIDEPQNMESDNAKAALESLKPACTLRYSATHKNSYNLLYRLDPVKAYDLRLVKRIEVASVMELPGYNQPYIKVLSITATKAKITAKLEIDQETAKGPARKVVSVSQNGADLFEISGKRDLYNGYIVGGIDAGSQFIAFENGVTLEVGQTQGGYTDDIMRIQIEETVKEHFEKELRISRLPQDQQLKVLSLFFIDRVANYAPADGKLRTWFIETYERLAALPRYAVLKPAPVDKVHDGYFAEDKNGAKDSSEGRATGADNDAYHKIMRAKEVLLSREEPLRFIFSHSALREGWDNPNVFQICTLNETKSVVRKRQEIGRGLRLPVRENGERSFDADINRLTVVANESYHQFAGALQKEMQDEWGVSFKDRIVNKRDRQTASLKQSWMLDEDFKALWEKIKQKTRYRVQYDTEKLIQNAIENFKFWPVNKPDFEVLKGELITTEEGVDTKLRSTQRHDARQMELKIPDLLGFLQRETELTRSTLAKILIGSGRLGEVHLNPQQFVDGVLRSTQKARTDLLIDGIKYEPIAGQCWDMMFFETKELESYTSKMIAVEHSVYDYVVYDSEVERKFAEELDAREDIKLFIKLPAWFKIETPLGTYNPDWAIVQQKVGEDEKLYLVRETKGADNFMGISEPERKKILCGKGHFKALGVDFAWAKESKDINDPNFLP